MPIYEYECGACGDRHEFIQKFSDSPKRKCPGCGALKLKRLVSAAAFHLKGDGWYVTDFRDKGKKKPGAKDEQPAAASKGDGAKADSDKSADKSADKSSDKSSKSGETPSKKSSGGDTKATG
ncbi:MAG: zinc ribbon domain-containing protein [Gammaproteobacteria bacterium]|nr:zinc ribbon domain-containing protein [Gammaproteobacteria bacterium]NIM72185.1 zinc ribbon domain-containing protein [Gammaproteobacteria bacterium]NIN39100.1 zinc ribbon domain-containing protein [Gammaproteobacteria bacterium]NIO23933.1 zinc ribbon domain-containing protein [Gammaproteobacteria bacterium]NIO64585.1 zinc ribbon domain-containing protein [Gammaproteobacteria bacterium]